MTEPKRLLESTTGECDSFEAELLRTGRGDAMAASAKRALVAAALGGTLTVAASTTAATTASATATKVGTSALAKWMLVVLATTVAVSAGVLDVEGSTFLDNRAVKIGRAHV